MFAATVRNIALAEPLLPGNCLAWGENRSAPVNTLFLLAKGVENKIEPVSTAEAARCLLRNILFFAEDAELVELVFRAACEFVDRVPVRRLTFVPDQRVWDVIQ